MILKVQKGINRSIKPGLYTPRVPTFRRSRRHSEKKHTLNVLGA